MSFEWSQVQPGDVVAWVPPASKLTRRILVEEFEADPPDSIYRVVWGVEVTSRYGIRGRRGTRNLSARKPFWINAGNVTDTARGGERIAALLAHITKLRAHREGTR